MVGIIGLCRGRHRAQVILVVAAALTRGRVPVFSLPDHDWPLNT